jgi:hypothetical protein
MAPQNRTARMGNWACRKGNRPLNSCFRRDRLPSPVEYYASHGVQLSKGGAWRSALCPFHGDTHPSLRVHIESGAFRCMACGAHGSDVLAFHRQRHGLGFKEAAKALSAWEVTR